MFARFFEGFKSISKRIGITVQTAVVSVLLFLVYFVGIGATKLLMFFWGRSLSEPWKISETQKTYWLKSSPPRNDSHASQV